MLIFFRRRYKLPLVFLCFALLMSTVIYAENTASSPKLQHHAGKLTLGFNTGLGYNLINRVDGTLAVIPNNASPNPSPGTPVYSNPISVSIDAPFFSLEYWVTPSWSLKFETGVNLFVVGATHTLADFAYLLSYWKMNLGGRYYFAQQHVDYLFLGLGWFADFPMDNPWIGFIRSKGNARITTGPYFEIGMTYPVTEKFNVELFGRWYFGIRALTLKSDKNFLTTIALSPLDIGFGLNWTIL